MITSILDIKVHNQVVYSAVPIIMVIYMFTNDTIFYYKYNIRCIIIVYATKENTNFVKSCFFLKTYLGSQEASMYSAPLLFSSISSQNTEHKHIPLCLEYALMVTKFTQNKCPQIYKGRWTCFWGRWEIWRDGIKAM